jgi:hypothetical protein
MMKQPTFGTLIFASLLFLAGMPAQGIAQTYASAPTVASAMQAQLLPKIRVLQRQARSRMLAALAPAHLALLSRIVGELAVEQNPDFDGAAKRLNAALSPAESRAVLAAESSKMTAVRSAVHNALTPKRAGMRASPSYMRRAQETNAGLVLLRSAVLLTIFENKT